MKRHAARLVFAVLVTVSVTGAMAAPALGNHTWSSYCGGGGVGYGHYWENSGNPGSGDVENSCSSDDEWGNNLQPVESFHDKLTALHLTDRPDDGTRMCWFGYEHADFDGSSLKIGALTNGQKYEDGNVGSTWNDRVDSHIQFGDPDDTCG